MTTKEMAARLAPEQVEVSPKFRAMLGYMLGESWTEPEIVSMTITSEGLLLISTAADPLVNEIAGTDQDLWRNLHGVAETVGLNNDETEELMGLAKRKIHDFRA